MAFIKYSVGQITSVRDKDSIEKKEENNSMADKMSLLIVCSKCGLQHMILQGELKRTCFCGNIIETNKLS